MRLRKSRGLVGLFGILLATGVVSGLFLMQQIQPAVPVTGQIVANCSPQTFPTPTSVPLGSNGIVTFSCNSADPNNNPAFTTGGPVIATPTITGFTAPYNTTRLYIYYAIGPITAGSCSSRTGNQKIESGISESMPAAGWNYCTEYIQVPPTGLPSFTVTWNL